MSAEFLNAFGSDLAASKNQEHFNFIRRRINENLERKVDWLIRHGIIHHNLLQV